MRTIALTRLCSGIAIGCLFAGTSLAQSSPDDFYGPSDFGQLVEQMLKEDAQFQFGIGKPLAESSTLSITAAQADADPRALVTVADGLRVRVVSAAANLGPNIDQFALWPSDRFPTYLIACNEEGPDKAGVQRIRLRDGAVQTILTGTQSCDPVRRTAWGTIVIGEEAGSSGSVLEIIDPEHTSGVIYDRTTQVLSGTDAGNVAFRPALGHLSFEGIALYDSGLMYYGDENRPLNGVGGGAFFKFVPDVPFTGGAPITALSQSPLAGGRVYGLRLGKRSSNTDFGQGSNTGQGTWIEIPVTAVPGIPGSGVDLRAAAATLKLSGYYRPEDLDIDVAAKNEGLIRACGANTGNEDQAHNWGEVICITDGTTTDALANAATPELQMLVVGNPEQAMMDNVAYQRSTNNWIFHEDGDGPDNGRNNDIWTCLDDGLDANTLSDGCVRFASLNDLNAESTGGIFDASGTRFYFSVQHNVTGHGVILGITGWR